MVNPPDIALEWTYRPKTEGVAGLFDPIPGLLVNQPGDTGLGTRILELINASLPQETLLVISPLIQDSEVVAALIAAHGRGVFVRLLTEARGDKDQQFKIALDVYGFTKAERDQASSGHHRALGKLCHKQVSVRGFRFCAHAKLIILADRIAIVSSANLTANSLGRGEPSVEIGVEIDAPEIVGALRTTFQALWKEAPLVFDSFGDGKRTSYSIQSRSSLLSRLTPFASWNRSGFDVLWHIPGVASPLTLRLTEAIEAARESIVLATYSFYDLDQGLPRLEAALLAALRRKVAVTLVVRPGDFAIDPSTRRLVEAGMVMLGLAGLHAKAVKIDRSFCLLTSANINRFSLSEFSTPANFAASKDCSNLELGLAGPPEAGLLAPVAVWCERLTACASHRWVPSG